MLYFFIQIYLYIISTIFFFFLDGKIPVYECIEKKGLERLITFLTHNTLQQVTLECIGVILQMWIKFDRTIKKCTKHQNCNKVHETEAEKELKFDNWVNTSIATKLLTHTIPLLRASLTRKLACYVLSHYSSSPASCLVFIQTPSAIPTLLDVHQTLVESKDGNLLVQLSAIIACICMKPTKATISKVTKKFFF